MVNYGKLLYYQSILFIKNICILNMPTESSKQFALGFFYSLYLRERNTSRIEIFLHFCGEKVYNCVIYESRKLLKEISSEASISDEMQRFLAPVLGKLY